MKYELTPKEYKKALTMSDEQLFEKNICPECIHRMEDGKCLLHGSENQIKMFRI